MGQPRPLLIHPRQYFMTHRDGQFCRCRWRWRTFIGHKINQGCIRFMPHRRNQRDVRSRRSTRHNLFIKAPQILKRTTATSNDQHVGAGQCATWCHFVKASNGTGHFGAAFFPLHGNRPYQNTARKTIAQTMQNITNNRTRGRCDNADHLGQIGQWTFSGCIEQPFCCQCRFAFFQHRHKGTYARRFDVIYHQLIFRLSPKRCDPTRGHNLHPLFWWDAEATCHPFPDHRG